MDIQAIKSNPKLWAGVIVGGLGLGLLLRKRRAASRSSAAVPVAGTVDPNSYALAGSSTGAYAGAQGAGSYAGTSPTSPGAGGPTSIIPSVTQDLQDANTQLVVDNTRQVITQVGAGGGLGRPGVNPSVAPSSGSSVTAVPSGSNDPLAAYYGKFVNTPAGHYFAVYGPGNIVNEDAAHVAAHPDRVNVTDQAAADALYKYVGVV